MSSVTLTAPAPGSFAHYLLRTLEIYVNAHVPNALVITVKGDSLEIMDCKYLGDALESLMRSGRWPRPEMVNIPRTPNDNNEGVLGGVLSLLGLRKEETIGAAALRLAKILKDKGCRAPIVTSSREYKLPQIAKVNYMEKMSAYITSIKPKEGYHPLVVLLVSLGAALTQVGVAERGGGRRTLLFLIPGEDLLEKPTQAMEIHRELVMLARNLSPMPPTTKLLGFAAVLAATGRDADHVADEYLIQAGKRYTVINSYPMRVAFIVRALPKRGEWLWALKAFLRAAASQGAPSALKNAAITVSNHAIAYASTGSSVHKFMAVRQLTMLISAAAGESEVGRAIRRSLEGVSREPLTLLSNVASLMAGMSVS